MKGCGCFGSLTYFMFFQGSPISSIPASVLIHPVLMRWAGPFGLFCCKYLLPFSFFIFYFILLIFFIQEKSTLISKVFKIINSYNLDIWYINNKFIIDLAICGFIYTHTLHVQLCKKEKEKKCQNKSFS